MSVDINGAITQWLTNVLREIGDPDGLRDHADELKKQAEHIKAVHAQMATKVQSSSWSGADYEAFSFAWQEHAKLAEDTTNSIQSMANGVDEHAERSWEIFKEVIGISLEILEILAIGLLLSWIFAGITNLLWARVAPLIERIVQIMERYRAMLADFAEWARGVGSSAGKVGEKIGTAIGKGVEKVFSELPDEARTYVNFYLADAAAPTLSGRDVAWADNAWQIGLFFGMDIGNHLVKYAVESINFGKRLTGVVEDASAQGGMNARSDLRSEGSLATDGAAAEVEGTAPSADAVDLFGDAASGDARSKTPPVREADQPSAPSAPSVRGDSGSTESPLAAEARAIGSHHATRLRDVRLESEPVTVEWPAAEPRDVGLTGSVRVREAAAPELQESAGARATRNARSSSASGRAEQVRFSNDSETGESIRIARPGGDEDALSLSYRGPNMIRTVRPDTPSEIPHSEAPTTETPLPAEAHPSTPAHAAPEAGTPQSAQMERAIPHPEAPTTETPLPAEPHPGLAHDSPSHPSELLPPAHETPVDVFSDVDRAVTRMDEVLSPHPTVNASEEFGSPGSTEYLKGHEPYQKKSLGEAVKDGVNEAIFTVVGNLETNAAIAHRNGTDTQLTWEQVGLQALGGTMAGVRQTLFHSLPVGDRFGYRNEPLGSPSLLRWLASAPVSWAYYSMYLTAKEAVLHGIAGQTTPTEITRANSQ
ncbi:WXG100 family type VII secretion target [Streptomyces sp900105755]|uniref:WXG100 family type VII secretion target n=1 Tax=Streptomyces sp. 900105755 TaxID=3154389 RepID=UPI0033182C3B